MRATLGSAAWLAGVRAARHRLPTRAVAESHARRPGADAMLARMQYLAQWRMQAASQLLIESRAGVAAIALEVGYESEAAFARAFKRLVGLPPAAWRRAASAR